MSRREFIVKEITVNGRAIRKILVDSHVEKHKDITDDLILDLVRQLDGTDNAPDDRKDGFEYFANLLMLNENQYRLVWLLEEKESYVGVITVYRDNRRKE